MDWDEGVYILCTGSGLDGLALRIAAVDAGVDVFLADSAGSSCRLPSRGQALRMRHAGR